jgi:hypothetical protein
LAKTIFQFPTNAYQEKNVLTNWPASNFSLIHKMMSKNSAFSYKNKKEKHLYFIVELKAEN